MMTTSDKEALARRAVKCKGWRWMPRMRLAGDGWAATVAVVAGDMLRVILADEGGDRLTVVTRSAGESLPDLDDPATLGCLLALVREAWGEPAAYPAAYTTEAAAAEYRGLRPQNAVDSDGGGWHVVGWGVNRGRGSVMEVLNGFSHRSEVEALVAALEAAR